MAGDAGVDLPPLRDIIARHNIRTRKALGQNFLLDQNLTDRIARAAGPFDGSVVYEVGPGPGGLTRSLLQAGAQEVVAIERDPRCVDALQELADAYPGRLTVKNEDALEISSEAFDALRSRGKIRIVANLPYNIATVLLTKWLHIEYRQPTFESMTLMFQKEVADRISAAPGSKARGRLSILCQWLADCRSLFDVSPSAFVPPPKVTSTVVQLIPRQLAEGSPSIDALEDVTRAAFGQRRKMLRSSLKSLKADVAGLLAAANIDGVRRAETLSVEEFNALASAYQKVTA